MTPWVAAWRDRKNPAMPLNFPCVWRCKWPYVNWCESGFLLLWHWKYLSWYMSWSGLNVSSSYNGVIVSLCPYDEENAALPRTGSEHWFSSWSARWNHAGVSKDTDACVSSPRDCDLIILSMIVVLCVCLSYLLNFGGERAGGNWKEVGTFDMTNK